MSYKKLKTKNKLQSGDKRPVKRLGDPSKRLMSGIYRFRVTRYNVIDRKKQEFYCCLEDAKGNEYTYISKDYLNVGYIYPFRVKVSSALGGGIRVDVISIVTSKDKSTRSNNYGGYRRSNNSEPTIYKGDAHLIYTPMGNKR